MTEDTQTFSDGYIAGWQSVTGSNLLPSIPAHAIPVGKTPYDHGYEEGRRRAQERKDRK